MSTNKTKSIFATTALVAILLSSFAPAALASSHREAPLTAGDPKIDATDLYAFVSPDKPDTVTLIADYIPFENPAGGPNFDAFDDNALYDINIDNNGDGKADIVYQFNFKTKIQNPNTFLYNTGVITSDSDPNWNQQQSYTLTKIEGGVSTVLGTDLTTPPVNVGAKSTPNYAALQAEAIHTLGGLTSFAGQSDDPFFADTGSLFDLLSIRKLPGNAGGGINTFQGSNVHSIALQIPSTEVTLNRAVPTSATDTNAVIGVWTTAYRHSSRVLELNNKVDSSNDWIQVSRLGQPLVNEVVVPVGSKDLFNSSKPEDDAQFANGVADPEIPKLLTSLYGIKVPPQGPYGSLTQRDDLETIFLTGIPGLNQPANVKPSEELRLNVAIAPTITPSNLGVIGGDNQGYPNGRRLTDDVIDISLRAMAGAAYPLFHPGYIVDATGAQLGDGVDSNDLPFRTSFPYLALPHSGSEIVPHSSSTIIDGLNAIISDLKQQIIKLFAMIGVGGGTGTSTSTTATSTMSTSTNPGGGMGTTTATSTTPVNDPAFKGTISPALMTVKAGQQINFNGRDFSHEKDIIVSLNGSIVTRGHADGGGNFSTGSVNTPATVGTYMYVISESGTNNLLISTITVQ